MNRRLHRGLAPCLALGFAFEASGGEPQKLPNDLHGLPASTPVALYIPRLGDVLMDVEHLRPALGTLDPNLVKTPTPNWAPLLLWGVRSRWRRPPRNHGLDLSRPLVVRLDASLGAAVFAVPLTDPEVFRRWLRALPAPSRTVIEISGTDVEILAPNSTLPLSCVVEPQRALCQLGVPSSGNALRPLEAHLSPPDGLHLGEVSGLAQAWSSLSSSARWTALVRPVLLARGLARRWGSGMRHAHRLHTSAIRREVAVRARELERRAVSHARWVQALAASIEASPKGVRAQMVFRLSGAGRERLARWFPERPVHSRIRPWTNTPALFSLFLQAEPSFAAGLARWAGLEIPSDTLDGVLGLIGLGVDVHCPQAKSPLNGRVDWAFLFPSALAVGLRGPQAANRLYTYLEPQMTPNGSPSVERRAPLSGRVDGGALEVHVRDDLLLAGSGPMGGYAGLRRLRTLAPHSPATDARFLRAMVDVGAIHAALGGGGFATLEHRRELRWMDTMRHQWAPLIEAIHRIEVSGVREDHGRQLRFELAFGKGEPLD